MVATAVESKPLPALSLEEGAASTPLSALSPEEAVESKPLPALSLEEFIAHPPEGTEWVDGNVIEKTGMTIKHSVSQGKLIHSWQEHILSTNQRGAVCPEALCRTLKQARRPDVAYITPELLEQFSDVTVLPQSFPLVAEVASPDDSAEELFAKAQEYLEAGCQEIWLLFPETRLIMVKAQQRWHVFHPGETVKTQVVLADFSIAVDKLLP